MKIEKINENQIRCIIEREDLEEHKLQLSELISGSSRVRELFRDLMERAFYEVGFDADNIPLMIEALPMNGDCLVLVITKVDNPAELADRYANVPKLNLQMEPVDEDDEDYEEEDVLSAVLDAATDDMDTEVSVKGPGMEHLPFTDEQKKQLLNSAMDMIAPFTKALAKARETAMQHQQAKNTEADSQNTQAGADTAQATSNQPKKISPLDLPQYYIFESLETVMEFSLLVTPFYEGDSELYKDPASSLYYLVLKRYNSDKDSFKRACHLATDYATTFMGSYTTPSYIDEHFIPILKEQALETLASL